MLYKVIIEDGTILFSTEEEYLDIKETLDYMGIKFDACIVEDRMYAIHWYDYIDDEWRIIWSTQEEYESIMYDIIKAEVEYEIQVFN